MSAMDGRAVLREWVRFIDELDGDQVGGLVAFPFHETETSLRCAGLGFHVFLLHTTLALVDSVITRYTS